MAATFERGDLQRPKGHALLYFSSPGLAAGEVLASYVVILPIAINPAKYIPPAFASRLPPAASAVAATALPPIPEAIALAELRRLAEFRGDDLLAGGQIENEPERAMLAAHEACQEYATRYQEALQAVPAAVGDAPEESAVPDEDVLRWMMQSEKARIGELARLTGQLRYAMEGNDDHLLEATVAQVQKLGRFLPEKYRIDEFVAAAQRPGDKGRRLAELYIDRCYKLGNEEYETLAQLDREIEALERSGNA